MSRSTSFCVREPESVRAIALDFPGVLSSKLAISPGGGAANPAVAGVGADAGEAAGERVDEGSPGDGGHAGRLRHAYADDPTMPGGVVV
jgi:hypothetical protein